MDEKNIKEHLDFMWKELFVPEFDKVAFQNYCFGYLSALFNTDNISKSCYQSLLNKYYYSTRKSLNRKRLVKPHHKKLKNFL